MINVLRIFKRTCALAFCAASMAPAQTNAPVPATFQGLYSYLDSQINQFQGLINSQWNGTKTPLVHSAQLLSVSPGSGLQLLGPNVRSQYLQELQRLRSVGVQAVTMSISYPLLYQPFYDFNGDPQDYQKMVDFYKGVSADVHGAGLQLIVETSVAFTGYYSQHSGLKLAEYYATLSLENLTNQRAQNAITILQQVQPDYLNLGSEPDTQAGLANQPALNTASGYATYVGSMMSQINAANAHNIKIGAGIGTWLGPAGPDFVNALLTTGIDYLDLHIYPVNKGFFDEAATLSDIFIKAGKPVAMSEAWLLKESDSELATGNVASDPTIYSRDSFSFWAPLDQKFLTAVVDLANWKRYLYVSAFWSRYFWAYIDYNTWATASSDQVTNAAQQAASTALTAAVPTFTGTYTTYKSLTGLTVVSAASFGTKTQSPDSIVSIFGTGLATGTTVADNLLTLPTVIDGTGVAITDSANKTSDMGIYFVSTDQINAVIPRDLAPGPATITVHSPGAPPSPSTVTIATVAPAFFTANQSGTGAPAARVITNTAAGQLTDVAFQCTAGVGTCTPKPISLGGSGDSVALELYGTGIRGHSSAPITAMVGSTPVQVTFAGAQSQYAGFDQVDLVLPGSLVGAGTVNVTFTVDGVSANVVTINIQ